MVSIRECLPLAPKPVAASAAPITMEPAPPPRLRYAHRSLPGGGRILVGLSDGTPIGVVRYDVDGRENLPLLLQAFASIVQERIAGAQDSAESRG